MAKQTINLGVIPTGVGGDTPRSANTKINANFDEIYGWGGGGALAKLIGGNTFSGTQEFLGPISSPSVTSTGSGAQLNFVDRNDFSRTWSLYSSSLIASFFCTGFGNRLSIEAVSGIVSATSFNPTSSADVKDYLEGYAGDACEELDRLVVITYRYRPEFNGPDGVIAGLLAENVNSVWPNATGGGYDVTVEEPVLNADGIPQFDDSGSPITAPVTRRVHMNVDIMQTLARTVRAHQQKNRRIKQLEETVASLVARLDAAGI